MLQKEETVPCHTRQGLRRWYKSGSGSRATSEWKKNIASLGYTKDLPKLRNSAYKKSLEKLKRLKVMKNKTSSYKHGIWLIYLLTQSPLAVIFLLIVLVMCVVTLWLMYLLPDTSEPPTSTCVAEDPIQGIINVQKEVLPTDDGDAQIQHSYIEFNHNGNPPDERHFLDITPTIGFSNITPTIGFSNEEDNRLGIPHFILIFIFK